MKQLSIIAPAHRTQYWLEFYKSIVTNLDYEIIFVTDNLPEFTLPKEFKVILSMAKPVQCVEIALREAQGEVIHWTADDTTYNAYAFDLAYFLYKLIDDHRVMIAFRNFENGFESTEDHRFFNPTAPRMMPYGLMSKQLIDEVGKCDKRFIAGQWDNDLIMRGYEKGGTVILCKTAIAYSDHIAKHNGEYNLREETWEYETKLLKELWMLPNGTMSLKRLKPLEVFENQNLLTITQGVKGKWQ